MATSILTSPAPYHILAYGTLLGTTFFHSFINGPVMFKTVGRHAFSAIQQGLFPIYFGIQTAVPVVLAFTYPGNTLFGLPSGIQGLLHEYSRWVSLAPIATIFVSGLLNLTIMLPLVNGVMKERRGQVKRDGKEWFAEGPHSEEMRSLNKKFGILHGISSLLNLATFIGAVVYGFNLGARVQSIADKAI